MSCGGSSNLFQGFAWTNGTTTGIFIPFTEAIEVSSVEAYRIEMELRNKSGDIEVKRAYQYSNDGLTWESEVGVGSWNSTEGFDYPSDYTDTDKTKRFIRFGVITRQISPGGTDNEQMRVTYRLDLKSR